MDWLMIVAAFSWCLSAYMVPVVWLIVWMRRRRDKTAVLQSIDWYWDPDGPVPKDGEEP